MTKIPVPRRRRSERGAVAVVYAICVTLLFGMAALGVDLGNAMNRKKQVQSQADFSALAAGEKLPNDGTPNAIDDEVVAAADFLNKDQPQDDATGCGSSQDCVTPNQLVNGNTLDGEVTYLGTDSLRVLAPRTQINFGLASVIGLQRTRVQAVATVGIFSPGTGVMPTYAVTGCDWGNQTLTDPSNGQVASVVPPLDDPTDNGSASLANLAPTSVPLGAVNPMLTINGTGFGSPNANPQTTTVGFYRDTRKPGTHKELPSTPVVVYSTGGNGRGIQVTIPSTVTAIEDVWWVRVRTRNNQGVDEWSPAAQALPLRVGDSVLECVGASNDGNFGTLILPRTDINKTSWLPANMAAGLQAPLNLHKRMSIVAATGLCDPPPQNPNGPFISGNGDDNNTRYSPSGQANSASDLVPRTNCVDTDTGLPANDTTQGMITGVPAAANPDARIGRLAKQPTTGNCAPSGGPDSRTLRLNNTNYTINDDIMSCFFLDNTVTIQDVARPNYTYNGGAPSISGDIYSSPRFFWVPVLQVKPVSGGCCHYSIVDFRAAFVTGQPSGASKTNRQISGGDPNGVIVTNNQVTAMRVVFFNSEAIAVPEGGPVVAYIGAGRPVLRLVN